MAQLEEYADTPEFKEFVSREYPHEIEEWDNSLSRRNFVKVMGASLALAGLTGCVIQPSEKIVPYVNSQMGLLPGKSNYFATAMSLGGVAVGLLAKSYDGARSRLRVIPIIRVAAERRMCSRRRQCLECSTLTGRKRW
ncbi:MAG: 4Fe-4S ferredoxin [Acidobacteria bacterium OLB17]|nr:MAG: 4Fe-4S ferredoxin [Acidobacteria bacterium OLB17]